MSTQDAKCGIGVCTDVETIIPSGERSLQEPCHVYFIPIIQALRAVSALYHMFRHLQSTSRCYTLKLPKILPWCVCGVMLNVFDLLWWGCKPEEEGMWKQGTEWRFYVCVSVWVCGRWMEQQPDDSPSGHDRVRTHLPGWRGWWRYLLKDRWKHPSILLAAWSVNLSEE